MNRKTQGIAAAAVALGAAKSEDFSGGGVVQTLKELAVATGCADDVSEIEANQISGVLNYIAENGESLVPSTPSPFNGKDIKIVNNSGSALFVNFTGNDGFTNTKIQNGDNFTIPISIRSEFDDRERQYTHNGIVAFYVAANISCTASTGSNVYTNNFGIGKVITVFVSKNGSWEQPTITITANS